MTKEFIRCPRCVVGIIPAGGACIECGLLDPDGDPPAAPQFEDRPSARKPRMTLDQFRAWLRQPPEDEG